MQAAAEILLYLTHPSSPQMSPGLELAKEGRFKASFLGLSLRCTSGHIQDVLSKGVVHVCGSEWNGPQGGTPWWV